MRVYSGVQAWKDGQDALHLGSDGKDRLFTYDLTAAGIDTFEFPFCWSEKGCLSTWFSGNESACDMLSMLLSEQAFTGYPYHDGLGYVFRKGVPRLVFLFTNEYDNYLKTMFTGSNGVYQKNGLVVLGLDTKTRTVKFLGLDSDKVKATSGAKSTPGNDAPDPFCLRMLMEDDADMQQFPVTIGITDQAYIG